MSISKKLEKQLFDIFDEDSNDCKWVRHKDVIKENYICAGPMLEVDPEDAKTIEEVKSFKMCFDMTAIEEHFFKRKE